MIILLLPQRATTTIMIIIIIDCQKIKNHRRYHPSSWKTAVSMLSIDQAQFFQQISAIYYKRYMPPMAMRPISSDPCCKSSSTNHAQALRWFITIPYQQLPPRPAQHFSLKFVAAHTDKPTNRRQLTLTAIMYKMHTQQEEANNSDR